MTILPRVLVFGLVFCGCSSLSHPKKKPELPSTYQGFSSDVIQEPHQEKRMSPTYVWYPEALKVAVDVNVTHAVSFQTLVNTLASIAKVPVVIKISKLPGVPYQARGRPIYHVLQDLCRIYKIQAIWRENTLFIEDLQPYHATYNAQFLGQKRATQSHLFLGNQGISDTQTREPSQGHVQGKTQHEVDFWKELDQTLKTLLSSHKDKARYSLNPYAGLIMLWGDDALHRALQSYLEKIYKILSVQILIEARVIEVTLNQESQFGIDWSTFFGKNPAFRGKVQGRSEAMPEPSQNVYETGLKGATFFLKGKNFQSLMHFIEENGHAKTLSNPRVLATHNQPTIFWVGSQKVFFTKTVSVMYGRDKPQLNETTSKARTIPVGLSLLVHPSLNLETQEIMLYVQPTLSDVLRSVKDPTLDSYVPEVNVRKMDAVVTVKPNQMVLIGGLMREKTQKKTTGVPVLGTLPLFGRLFRHEEDAHESTELVILLKVSLL